MFQIVDVEPLQYLFYERFSIFDVDPLPLLKVFTFQTRDLKLFAGKAINISQNSLI